MANEIQATFALTVVNGSFMDYVKSATYNVTQSVIGQAGGVVSVGTAEQDLAVGGVGTLGYLFLRNTDPTNFVTYGPKSGASMVAFGRLKPGEISWLRLEPGITYRWKADTAACKVLVKLYEN